MTETSRPKRHTKVPNKPGNVYGDKYPTQIEKEIGKKRDWSKIFSEKPQSRGNKESEPVPRPSSPPPERSPSPESTSSSSGDDQKLDDEEVERSLEHSSDDSEEDALAKLCREGGVKFQTFLISKAVSSTPMEKPPKEWKYRDIANLPKAELEEWRMACDQELEALRRRQVYDLVECPCGRKVIKNHWVFDIKTDGQKKAHLVAKGFSKVEGLDYDQVFSPIVQFESVHLILAMAALEGWVLTGLSIRNAYLYGKLDEEIYMEQPEGFIVPGKENIVLHLRHALYELKQAGLAWWQALKQSMEKLRFTSLSSDAGLFLFRNRNSFVIAIIYVNDVIFCGPLPALVNHLKEEFKKIWETQDLGDVTEFLHMRITQSGIKIHLDQCTYLETVLQQCGMQNAKSAAMPLLARYVPTLSVGAPNLEIQSRFQTVIGSLLYLMLGTCLDIAFAVTKLAQHAANPSKEHLEQALYICCYLVGTSKYRLMYDGTSGKGISACTDSDWASDNSTH